jgi:hypothetical protein
VYELGIPGIQHGEADVPAPPAGDPVQQVI